MTQGKFSKEEARATREAVEDIMKNGMTRKKSLDYLGHFNDIFLFLSAAEAAAPSEDVK
jgi:hypothetical protein